MKNLSIGIKIALIILLITFFYLFAVTFLPMTDKGAELAKTIVPFLLGTVIGTLIGFYWGNSHKEQIPPQPSQIDEATKGGDDAQKA